jgi:5,10-methylenetetrahydromethanopterin reductase
MANPFGVPVGFGAGTGMQSVDQVRSEARWAESAGFDTFWVSQIFGVDPIVALAAIAAEVPGLAGLGTSVVPLTGRHPLALAAQARTAQDALAGRFTLGVGPSHAMVSEGFFGEPYDRPFTRTVEFLAALSPLLRGEHADVSGDLVETHGWLTIDAAPCPLLLAALGPKMLELAGRVADGTTLGSCGPRTIASHVAPAISAAAAGAGRPPPRIQAMVEVAVTADPESARAASRVSGALYADLPAYRRVLDLEGVASGADLLLAGSPASIVDGLSAYVEAGVTELRLCIGSSDEQVVTATREALADLLGG